MTPLNELLGKDHHISLIETKNQSSSPRRKEIPPPLFPDPPTGMAFSPPCGGKKLQKPAINKETSFPDWKYKMKGFEMRQQRRKNI